MSSPLRTPHETAGTHYRHPPAGTLAFLAGLVVLSWCLLLFGGVRVGQATRVLGVLVVQTATGALLWRLARGSVASYITELVGMGIALGTLTSLLGAQLLLPTPLAPF